MPTYQNIGDLEGGVHLEIENIGGINQCSVDIQPGVTALVGRNATNRTSFLRALGSVLGGTSATLKRDSEEGQVTLSFNDCEYTRMYRRTESGIVVDGTPYSDDEALVDHFVTLLEDNPARRAVRQEDDLHKVIMRPIDTSAIERRIRELQSHRDDLEEKLTRVRNRRGELPTLESKRNDIKTELASIDDELTTLQEEVTEFESDSNQSSEIKSLMERLDDRRQELREVRNRIDVVEAEIEALENEREQLLSQRNQLSDVTEADIDSIQQELDAAREQKRDLDDTVMSLTTIADFNENVLEDDGQIPSGAENISSDITEQLAPKTEQEVTCWTCGSVVKHQTVKERINDLREVIAEKRKDADEFETQIDNLQSELQEIREKLDKKQKLDNNLRTIEEKLDNRGENLTDLRSQADQLQETTSDLEQKISDAEISDDSDLMATHEQISYLQYKRGQLQQQMADVEDEIDSVQSLPTVAELRSQRDDLVSDLEDERGRIDKLESEAVNEFNDHMDEVLKILRYDNISRVWIDRKKVDRRAGNPETELDLHVIRESNTGVFEDEISHMSESERELVGLIVALSGYLVHETYEKIPFMLLDSLEAIDADRIADLIAYLAEETPYLVVALLPGDAEALDDSYEFVEAEVLS